MKRLTLEWMGKADDDYTVASTLIRSRKAKVPDAICFHSQQCAEKLLKARLCEDGVIFPRTHDLVELLRLLIPSYPLWAALNAATANLNAYAVNTRYPGDSATLVEARQALKDCTMIRDEVRTSFRI